MPRHPDPDLEQRILDAASRLWARGGEKALTMRAVAKAANTTTPTVYERYRHRDDILRALRLVTRRELFATLNQTRTLREGLQSYLEFALAHSHAYEMLVPTAWETSFTARTLALVQFDAPSVSAKRGGRKLPGKIPVSCSRYGR